MLIGDTAGIVVANHSPELASLRDSNTHRVYFAASRCAAGIIEGLTHYGLVSDVAESGEAQELAEVCSGPRKLDHLIS
jgi:sucrose-phosphate synthase